MSAIWISVFSMLLLVNIQDGDTLWIILTSMILVADMALLVFTKDKL